MLEGFTASAQSKIRWVHFSDRPRLTPIQTIIFIIFIKLRLLTLTLNDVMMGPYKTHNGAQRG